MKVKIPEIIKIGIYPRRVIYKPYLKVDEGYDGLINHRLETIEVDPVLPKARRDACLIHEVVHLVDKNYDCHLGEDDISRIANGVAEFLFNNLGIEFDWKDIKED